jgi:peptidoglycan/xylan/chitin deacetylase (PgdA/CDA1 family)
MAKQTIIGLLLLPVSLLPFVAYFSLTPEGALLWAKVRTTVWTPRLPVISDEERETIQEMAPQYDGAVALLLWHGVGGESDGEGGLSVTPENFGEQLAALKAAGMNPVTARDVADALAGRRQLPPNAVMISFDDGRADAMLYADPLLEQAGMTATMFVITSAASSSGIYYAKWDDLVAYAKTGRWDIESHSASSHHFQAVPGGGEMPALTSVGVGESLSEYRLRVSRDLANASTAVEQHIGSAPLAFAFPFGAYGGPFDSARWNNQDIESILQDVVSGNHQIAFEQDDQETWSLTTCQDDPYRLRRLEVGSWSGAELINRISDAADQLADEATCSSIR